MNLATTLPLTSVEPRSITPRRTECARGRVKVRDRKGLDSRACECYSVVVRDYDRLLPSALAV
jgi:hypothetical protein